MKKQRDWEAGMLPVSHDKDPLPQQTGGRPADYLSDQERKDRMNDDFPRGLADAEDPRRYTGVS